MPIHLASSMIDGQFQCLWGALHGGRLMSWCEVIRAEQGWLYVQPLDRFGGDDGPAQWLSPSAIQGLIPWQPEQKPKAKRRRK